MTKSRIKPIDDVSRLEVHPYKDEDATLWDEFIKEAPMATFLHSRRYLAYHADRFKDMSLLIRDKDEQLVGVFLAAINSRYPQKIISHPGITYGGILHTGNLRGEKMLQALTEVRDYYAKKGFEVLQYKAVPYIYHRAPSGDDIYALFCLGANRYRCDLSCAIDFSNRLKPSSRRLRGSKKALKSGLEIKEGVEFLPELWQVLESNLQQKYGVKPVHSVSEISLLHSWFPDNIEFIVGVVNNEVVAGVVLYEYKPIVVHTQYIASNSTGYKINALDLIFDHCLEKAQKQGSIYFSFGVSTEQEGKYLNTGLYQFKSEFGGGGFIHEFYELNLKNY
jgi:hypothetical protein